MPGDRDDTKGKSEDLIREYLARRESGEDVTPEEYLTKYPELEKDLKRFFDKLKAGGAEGIDLGGGGPAGPAGAPGPGVPPDIEVKMLPKPVIEGKDPQLEKAVEVVMKELEENPPEKPVLPPYPPRAK